MVGSIFFCVTLYLLGVNALVLVAIGRLARLETLDVSWNNLQKLPGELGGCSALRELRCDSNNLRTLPRQLCGLHFLKSISACDNKLLALPLGKKEKKKCRVFLPFSLTTMVFLRDCSPGT